MWSWRRRKTEERNRRHCGFRVLASLFSREAALQDPRSFSSDRERRGERDTRLATLGVLMFLSMCLCAPVRSDEPVYDIDIPAMNAAQALNRFAEQTGAIMLFSYDLASARQTPAVRGRYTLLEGLELLLRDTGLSGGLSDKRVVNISPTGNPQRQREDLPVQNEKASLAKRISAFFTSLLAASAASGQQSDVQPQALEEIIVTATKRAESLQDVPIAVSALRADDIAVRGLTQYADYLSTVPGVNFQDAGPGQSQIRMRGIVASEGGGGPASVATYFGETVTSVVNLFGAKPNLRLVDIDRIEVLRGPQGTLFGANALAGVVRIVPAPADLTSFEINMGTRGFATAHADDASYHVEAAVNVPIIADRLAVRLVAYQDDIAGYIDNVVPASAAVDWTEQGEGFLSALTGSPIDLPDGSLVIPGYGAFTHRDVNSEDTWGVRANLIWRASDRLQFDLTHAVQDVTLNGQPFVDSFSGPYEQLRALDVYAPGKYGERLEVSTLVATYDWEPVALTSASNFSRLKAIFRDDMIPFVLSAFGAPLPWQDRTNSDSEVFTQEVRLQSRGDTPLKWLLGAFYLDQHADVTQTVPDYSCPTCVSTLLFDQDFAFRIPGPGSDARLVNQKQRSLFGEVSYNFASRWTIGLGGRYLEEDLERLTPATEGFLVGGSAPEEPARKGSSYEVNPSAYLRFEPSDAMTWYLQAARGFRSAQTNQVLAYTGGCASEAAAVGLKAVTDPDTLWSYELGLKTRLADGRVGLNAALYRQQWDGVQLPIQFDCGFGGTVNGGDVEGDGVEVEITARLTDALRLNLAGAYNNNEFVSVKPGVGFEVGERPPGAPQRNVSAGLQYDFALSATWSAFARADYSYVSSTRYKFGQIDPLVVLQDAYDLTNLRLGLQRGDLAVELFGRNVTDERAVVNTTDPSLGDRQYLARPRELGVELRYSFR